MVVIDSSEELLASFITLIIYMVLLYYTINLMNRNFFLMEVLSKQTYFF